MRYVKEVIETLLANDAHTAIKYVSPKEVVKATRRLSLGRIRKNETNVDVVLTAGRPNYAAREFIKKLVKAGEPFPVKKILLTFPSTKVKPKHAKVLKRIAKKQAKVRSVAAKVLGQTRARLYRKRK